MRIVTIIILASCLTLSASHHARAQGWLGVIEGFIDPPPAIADPDQFPDWRCPYEMDDDVSIRFLRAMACVDERLDGFVQIANSGDLDLATQVSDVFMSDFMINMRSIARELIFYHDRVMIPEHFRDTSALYSPPGSDLSMYTIVVRDTWIDELYMSFVKALMTARIAEILPNGSNFRTGAINQAISGCQSPLNERRIEMAAMEENRPTLSSRISIARLRANAHVCLMGLSNRFPEIADALPVAALEEGLGSAIAEYELWLEVDRESRYARSAQAAADNAAYDAARRRELVARQEAEARNAENVGRTAAFLLQIGLALARNR